MLSERSQALPLAIRRAALRTCDIRSAAGVVAGLLPITGIAGCAVIVLSYLRRAR